jgi:hypothetical protein
MFKPTRTPGRRGLFTSLAFIPVSLATAALVVAALLAALLLAAGGARPAAGQVIGVTNTPTPILPTFTFAPFVTSTLPAPVTLDPAVVPTVRPCPTPGPLLAGQRAVLTPGVNVRSAPSVSAALVNYYALEVVVTLIEGPVCAGGYNWWRISGEAFSVFERGEETRVGTGEPGWVIEGNGGRQFLNFLAPDAAAQCSPPLALRIGEIARVVTGLRAHESPDLDARVLELAPLGAEVTVLDGPVCADNLNFWRVTVPLIGGGQIAAWVGEGYPGGYWLETDRLLAAQGPRECFRPLRVGTGTRAAVQRFNNIPLNLRAAPGENAPVVAQLINGIAFDITGPPVCADGFNFWPVRVVGGSAPSGWLAEGIPGAYWWDIVTEAGP